MKHLLLAALAFACTASAQLSFSSNTVQLFGNATFDELCEIMPRDDDRVSCEGMAPPTVVYSKLVEYVWVGGRIHGAFIWDEPYVFVSTASVDVQATLRHEIAHYIRWYSGVRDNVCVEERTVRDYANQPWGPDERASYGCDENDEVIPTPATKAKL